MRQLGLIEQLNPVLRGFGNYYSHVVSKQIFSRMDHILMNQLKRWAYRRHSNKSRKWIRDKYFIKNGKRSWIFGYRYEDNGKKTIFALMKLSDIPIRRHIKVKCEANPFEPTWDTYFERRRQKCCRQRA